ncbi:MAG: hypothetical protein MPK62_04780 [Alphaproteobacteria bacterium]|nr:hypothetical protein [Alphaproteobacteria bacterium]MDA8030439.1 hypothetical protein [Alphaproteobacteria bacterium]
MSENVAKMLYDEEIKDFLGRLATYITLVQDDVHARWARVAMFWSFISLLFISKVFEITPTKNSVGVLGLSFRDLTEEKVSWFLFGITLYYAARFFFSVAKIWNVHNPLVLWIELCGYVADRKLVISAHFYERETEIAKSLNIRGANIYEVMNHNVNSPSFGIWENFVFRMFFPIVLCIVAFLALVWKLLTLP